MPNKLPLRKDSKGIRLTYALLFLIIIYVYKGFLYPTGILSQGIAALELGICAYLGVKTLKFKKRNKTINIVFILAGLIFVSYFFSPKMVNSDAGFISTFSFFRNVCGTLWICWAIYYLARKKLIPIKLLTWFFYLFYISAVIMFFYSTIKFMEQINEEFVTSNASYRFVYLMPFVALIKGKYKVLALWIGALAIALISVKRGAILGVSIEFVIFYYWKFKNSRNKILFLIGVVIVGTIAWHYLIEFYESNPYLQMRVEMTMEGGSSGRDNLISTLISHYFNSDFATMLFGFGFVQTLQLAGNYAHNDWIEMLIDCGAVGFIVYLMFFISIFKNIRVIKIPYKYVLILIFVAFLSSSLYSMVLFDEATSIGFIWLGFILGIKDSVIPIRNRHALEYREGLVNKKLFLTE